MNQHFSEADLLETFYTQPGESMPVMMHLADCSACAARYETLEAKLRGLEACHDEKPETFWARQRIAVMRKIDARRERSSMVSRISRVAAAAALVVVMGSGIWSLRKEAVAIAPAASPTQTASLQTTEPATLETTGTSDPWQSEELKDFHSVVAWESWVESTNGDKSL
jgi:anti-sigma factor RsiW